MLYEKHAGLRVVWQGQAWLSRRRIATNKGDVLQEIVGMEGSSAPPPEEECAMELGYVMPMIEAAATAQTAPSPAGGSTSTKAIEPRKDAMEATQGRSVGRA